MISDALVSFIPIGSAVAVTNVAVRSNIIDQLGTGAGTAPQAIIGQRTLFGMDSGVGVKRPMIRVNIGTAFASGTSINIAFQGAPDQGVGGNYQPGTWATYIETGPLLTANLTASNYVTIAFPPAFPFGTLPRYYSLLITPVGVFTAGTISSAIVTLDADEFGSKYMVRNYAVA